MVTRREFLTAIGASTLAPSIVHAATARTASIATPARAALTGVGVQLYMFRGLMRADPERTIARIAELGFNEIEWWGTWDRTPAQLRAMLESSGLRSPSFHVGTNALRGESLPRVLDAAATMGHRTIIIASLGGGDKANADAWKRVADLMNEAGRAASARGMKVGYHNHGGEATRFGDGNAYDILIGGTDAALVDMQLDAYWALNDGLEPIALLRKHAARIGSLHLKDATTGPPYQQVDLGQGIIDWKTFIATGAAARVTSVFLDVDDPPDVWATAGSARRYLRGLGY